MLHNFVALNLIFDLLLWSIIQHGFFVNGFNNKQSFVILILGQEDFREGACPNLPYEFEVVDAELSVVSYSVLVYCKDDH